VKRNQTVIKGNKNEWIESVKNQNSKEVKEVNESNHEQKADNEKIAKDNEDKNLVKSKYTDDEVKNNEDALELMLTKERYNEIVMKPGKNQKDEKNILIESLKKHEVQICVTKLKCNLNLAQENIHQSNAKEKASLKEVMKNEENKTEELLLHFEIYKNYICG